jgi:hypothetical protein
MLHMLLFLCKILVKIKNVGLQKRKVYTYSWTDGVECTLCTLNSES